MLIDDDEVNDEPLQYRIYLFWSHELGSYRYRPTPWPWKHIQCSWTGAAYLASWIVALNHGVPPDALVYNDDLCRTRLAIQLERLFGPDYRQNPGYRWALGAVLSSIQGPEQPAGA